MKKIYFIHIILFLEIYLILSFIKFHLSYNYHQLN